MAEHLFQKVVSLISLWPAVLIFVSIGVAGLKYGADWLVDGASNIGFRFGISAVMIGLTIVAFGTSAPELVVSVLTAAQGKPEICLGNVIGSNIANTTLILGATAVVFPLKIKPDSYRLDGPISLGAITMVFVFALIGNEISRIDGAILLTVFFSWLLWLIRKSLKAAKAASSAPKDELGEEEVVFHQRSIGIDIALILVGLICLVLGADALVAGSVATAQALGVPDIVVGLTVVAGGTSLPELAVCLMAALKKHGDITVGNVLGSNIFNALLILGTATVIAPIFFNVDGFSLHGDSGTLYFDIPFCVLISLVVIPMMAHNRTLGRGKGLFLLSTYVAYIFVLVIRNTTG